jgi:hypothetical protein
MTARRSSRSPRCHELAAEATRIAPLLRRIHRRAPPDRGVTGFTGPARQLLAVRIEPRELPRELPRLHRLRVPRIVPPAIGCRPSAIVNSTLILPIGAPAGSLSRAEIDAALLPVPPAGFVT